MLTSMTAFARVNEITEQGQFTWEIRSVNSRYLEMHFRLPEQLRELETQLRNLVKDQLNRGKVEISLRFQPAAANSQFSLNKELVSQLHLASQEVAALTNSSNTSKPLEILAWPGVLTYAEVDAKSIQQPALASFSQALASLVAARQREGEKLGELINQRMQQLKPLIALAEEALPQALANQAEQLKKRLGELLTQLDPQRLEAEMLLLAQKADIAEELDRLKTHISEVERLLTLSEPTGRRLDFMMQELNREANTLSSKALVSQLTQAAVDMKVLIEQAREQVQNLE